MKTIIAILGLSAALQGCVNDAGVMPKGEGQTPSTKAMAGEIKLIETADGTCGAKAARDRLLTDPGYLQELQARMDGGDRNIRIVPEDGIMTMDYRIERLTVTLDANGKPASVQCV